MRYDLNYYISNTNQAQVCVEIYYQCRIRNIRCFPEVIIPSVGRLDMVAIINERKKIIFECKDPKTKLIISPQQAKRYKKLKLPIILVNKPEDVEKIVEATLLTEFKTGIYTYLSSSGKLKKRYNFSPKKKET